jgi:hypothetical protein
MAENFSRIHYRGLIAKNDKREPASGIIWELIGLESGKNIESKIKWFRADEEDVAKKLVDAYSLRIATDRVKKSSFVIPVKMGGLEKMLLKEAGFSVRLTEGDDIVVSLRELTELPFILNKPVPGYVDAINSMTIRNFRNTIAKSIAMGKKGVCEDLEHLAMAWFDTDVSCYSKKSDDINGIMLFHERPSGVVSIALMVAFDQDFSKTLPAMMRFFVASCQEKYSLDTMIHFSRHNQPSFLLSEKLLPRGFGSPVYAGERMEK